MTTAVNSFQVDTTLSELKAGYARMESRLDRRRNGS